MSHIKVNGVSYQGNFVEVRKNVVIIDGVRQPQDFSKEKEIKIIVEGNCENISTDAGTVTIMGNAGSVKVTSGNVNCGDVAGEVKVDMGNITCGNVTGNTHVNMGIINKA